jgi:hypothetical protein
VWIKVLFASTCRPEGLVPFSCAQIWRGLSRFRDKIDSNLRITQITTYINIGFAPDLKSQSAAADVTGLVFPSFKKAPCTTNPHCNAQVTCCKTVQTVEKVLTSIKFKPFRASNIFESQNVTQHTEKKKKKKKKKGRITELIIKHELIKVVRSRRFSCKSAS